MFTRTLESLKPLSPTKLQHGRIMTMVLTLDQEHLGPYSTVTTTNNPTYFMYLMNKVFMEYLDKLVVIFIFGNILVYPKTEEESLSW